MEQDAYQTLLSKHEAALAEIKELREALRLAAGALRDVQASTSGAGRALTTLEAVLDAFPARDPDRCATPSGIPEVHMTYVEPDGKGGLRCTFCKRGDDALTVSP